MVEFNIDVQQSLGSSHGLLLYKAYSFKYSIGPNEIFEVRNGKAPLIINFRF